MCDFADIKISVIIPVYNARDYIRPAMDSVLGQTLQEIEIICVDDGSTDESFSIIKEYQESDERIRIVTEANAGPALARNNGLRRARGKYLAFLDADDFYEPEFLQALYERAEKDALDIVISDYDIYNSHRSRFETPVQPDHFEIFKDGRVTSKNEHPDVILTSAIGSAWNKLFLRSFVEARDILFLSDVKMYEDVYFTVCALALAERIGMVERVLMHHRVHNEQSRAKSFSKYNSQVPVVYCKIKEFLMKMGMYAPLASSYLNLSASRCYKIYNLLSNEAKENFWNLLNGEYRELLGWENREASDFENPDVFSFVANTQLYDHEHYIKRLEKGQTVDEAKDKKPCLFLRLFGRKSK